MLCASYGAGDELDLRWEWAYEVGESRRRAPLSADEDPGYRDLKAEGAIVAGLDVGLEAFGLRNMKASAPLVPGATLRGLRTMRFSTEVLPLLDGHPGVAVEITGEPADYREAGDSLRISVSAGDVAGETDWFDLGVTITVEGHEVAFTDLFVALNRNHSHLLLADGAYFSLEKPELLALQRLIDEARALQDTPEHGGRLLADQPVPGGAMGGVRRARCHRGPGTGVAAPGRRAPGAQLHRAQAAARGPARHAAAVPGRTGSAGWRSCGSTSSAASSPTTWDWVRRCSRWR